MKAIAEPMMVAARIQGPEVSEHGALASPDRMTPSSQGDLPMFATLPPYAAPSLTLERRARLRKKLRLLRGSPPAEDLVAVGEAPEALDYLHVPHGVPRRVRAPQRPEQ